MSRKHLQELIQNLQEFYKCPSCDSHYHLEDISFLGEIDTYCFVQLSCHECSLPVLAPLPTAGGAPQKSRRSDLEKAEVAKFAAMGSISADEIADFHRYISGYRGGFHRHKQGKSTT